MIKLVTLFGTGDTYLVCALYKAFVAKYGAAEIVCKSGHAAIPKMFGVPFQLNDAVVAIAEAGQWSANDGYTYVHPSCPLNYTRPDQFTFKGGDISQADMYRALLDLPLDTPLELPKIPKLKQIKGTVHLIWEARSWPNAQPMFWRKLANALKEQGYLVNWNLGGCNLAQLLDRCAESEWVIGVQCGVMSILTTARFPCRKSFCTPSAIPAIPIRQTFPYAYVSKFSGEDFDVDEYEITEHNHDQVVNKLLSPGASRSHVVPPTTTIHAPMAPGDFLDRLAVLTVKYEKFSSLKKHSIQREHDRYWQIYRNAPFCGTYLDALINVHRETYDLCSTYVPDALAGRNDEAAHAKAITLNKRRVELRQQIDVIRNSAYSEVKDYYR